MRRICTAGLCLMMMAVALGSLVTSSASADLKAQLKGGGSVVGVTFLSSATLPLLIMHNGSIFHCKDAINHGKFLTLTLGDILLRFLGCTIPNQFGGSLNCNTSGAGTGEIHLPLSTLFHLGLAHLNINTGRIPAAIILPVQIIKLECEGFTIEVRGSMIGALQRNGARVLLNTPFEDVNLNFQQTANGLQHLRLILMPGSTTPTIHDWEFSFNGGGFELVSEVANVLLDGFTTSGGVATSIELVEP